MLFIQVQTDFQQVGESQFLFNIPEADSINHIVVFLTGTMPLPLGMAGSVYFSWPDPAQPPSWIMLGYISNAKPSAIFKISQLKNQSDNENAMVPFGGTYNIFGAQPISHMAQIGVSIEPEANVMNLTPATVSTRERAIQKPLTKSTIFTFTDEHCLLRPVRPEDARKLLQLCV